MIYTSARWSDAAHTQVIGTDAEGRSETVPADYTLFRQPDDGPTGFLANGGVIAEYVEFFVDVATLIVNAPATLFGGPTLGEIYHGNR